MITKKKNLKSQGDLRVPGGREPRTRASSAVWGDRVKVLGSMTYRIKKPTEVNVKGKRARNVRAISRWR